MVHKVIKYEWCRGLMSIISFPSSVYHLGRLNRNSEMEKGKDIKHFFFPPDEVRLRDSVQPHRQQPTRLPRPWDSPGKNTGVGCHFLMHESEK